MTELMEHGDKLFIFFLSPILGLILDLALDKKKVSYLFGISFAFFAIPLLIGYEYVFPYSNQILGLILFGSIYCLFSKNIEKHRSKVISAVTLTGLAFCFLGFFAFISTMGGSQTVENAWHIKNYKIEYIKDQGFSGGPLMKYQISKYAAIPVLIKQVDVSVDNDTTNSCIIHFVDIKMDFNKCDVSLKNVN